MQKTFQAPTESPAKSPLSKTRLFPLTPGERNWEHRRYSILREVLGPDFHGPSSSHTAAPQLIALEARRHLGSDPEFAHVRMFNSFADTGDGHRTPIAIVAGLLGIATTDPQTPMALAIAEEQGVLVDFEKANDPAEHPNTLELTLRAGARTVTVKAISIGGGNFEMLEKANVARVA